jgi:hypothetical protein
MRVRLLKSLLVPGLSLVASLFVLTAHADFKRDYGSGKRAYNDGNYRDAVTDLEKAIADNAEAQAQVRIYGMRFEPYLPHYYLGQAKFNLGDCQGAMQAFRESIRQGLIQEQDQFSELQVNMGVCESQVVDVSAIAQAADEAINELVDAADSLAALGNENLLRSEWGSQWQPELDGAMGTADSLRERLARAVEETDPDAIGSITAAAGDATSAVNGTKALAEARIAAIRTEQADRLAVQQEEAARELRQAVAAAKTVAQPQDGSSQMLDLKQELDNQVTRAEGLSSTATALNQREIAQTISNTLRRFRQAEQDWQVQQRAIADQQRTIAERTPPPALKQVADAYFTGDYSTAASLARPDSLNQDRAKIQALLFRAAASYNLYMLSGEKETDKLRQAQADIRAIKRLNSGFSPYIAAFSPNFLQLFRQTG